MYVQKIMRIAVTLDEDAALVEAAERLSDPETNLVIVRDRDGVMQGVVSKTDVVKQDQAMRERRLHSSRRLRHDPGDRLLQVRCDDPRGLEYDEGAQAEARTVADADGRPIGMLNAGAVMQVLLEETEQEEELLRDYVMCVGYH